MARPSADALVLQFLRTVGTARVARIREYMATAPLPYGAGAARTAVWRLAREDRIERIGYGRYRIKEMR